MLLIACEEHLFLFMQKLENPLGHYRLVDFYDYSPPFFDMPMYLFGLCTIYRATMSEMLNDQLQQAFFVVCELDFFSNHALTYLNRF